MTLDDALAWHDARPVDRWKLVYALHPRDDNAGDAYAQMDADAMATLAEAVRAHHPGPVRAGCEEGEVKR